MKIVISGTTGFVGSNLVKLLEKDHQIIEINRRYNNSSNKQTIWDLNNSISKLPSISCDILIHCAAYVDSIGSESDFFKTNVEGTRKIMDKINFNGCIYISTSSVYTGLDYPIYSENIKIEENNITESYARSKFLAESIIKKNCDKYFIIRPHIIYGHGDTTLLPKLSKAIIMNRYILPTDGSAKLSITNIDNLTEFVKYIIEDNIKPGIYNFSDKKVLKVSEIFSRLSQKLNLKDPIYLKWIGENIDKIEKFFKIIKVNSRLNKYLIDSLKYDHILDLSKIEQTSFIHKYDIDDYVSST